LANAGSDLLRLWTDSSRQGNERGPIVMSENETEAAKPFVCSVCGRKFGRGEHLRRHAIAHANVKPFQCKFCQKRFARKYHLPFRLKLTAGTFSIATMRAVTRRGCNLRFHRSRRDGRVIGAKSSSLVVPAGFRVIDVNKLANRVPLAVLLRLVKLSGNHLPQMFPKIPHPQSPSRP
jgi:Zinc finger, C2H2 type